MDLRAHRVARACCGHALTERVLVSEGDALRRLVQRLVRAFGLLSSDQTPCGQPLPISHAHALMVLLESRRAGRRPTQQELGRVLGIDKSNVARLCSKMERAGQLTQERCPHDGRSRLLSLTMRGVRLARIVDGSSRRRFRQLMHAVPTNDRERVLSALSVLSEALVNSGAMGSQGAP